MKNSKRFINLRKKAEEFLSESNIKEPGQLTKEEIKKLFHELNVYQIELEMQNEQLTANQNELMATKFELEKSNRHFSQLFYYAPIGYVTLDKNGFIVQANYKLAEMLNQSLDQIESKPFFNFIVDEEQHIFRSRFRPFAKIPDGKIIEVKLKRKSSSLIYVLIEGNKVDWNNTEHNNDLILVAIHDITERKNAQLKLEAYKNDLEKIVQERTKSVVEMSQNLKLANSKLSNIVEEERKIAKIKDEFTDNISHELKTPLTSIMMSTQYIMKRIDSLSKEKIEERIKRIDFSSKKLLQLIEEILELSKLDSGNYDCQIVDVHLYQILNELSQQYQELIESKGIYLNMEIDQSIKFKNDSNHIYKIINNLLSNACKFTEKGGIDLIVQLDGDHILITVQDSGCGIEEDNFDLIFDRYMQVDRYKNERPGTGIGLNFVKILVEKHGGIIELESIPGKGSQFKITLPRISHWNSIN